MTVIIVIIPAQTYVLYDFAIRISFSYQWSEVHGPDWGQIILMPTRGAVDPGEWIQIAVGLLIFAFFGLGNDAMGMYRKWMLWLGFGNLFPLLNLTSRERRQLKDSQASITTSTKSSTPFFKKTRLSWPSKLSL